MAIQKDEAYKTFLRKLHEIKVEGTGTDRVAATLKALSFDLPLCDASDAELLEEHLREAKNWSNFPAVNSKIVENVLSLAGEGHSQSVSAEKGCIHFSNIAHHILVKLCRLSVDVLRDTGDCSGRDASVAAVLISADSWLVTDESENPAPAKSDDASQPMDMALLEHSIAAEEDDDDFVYESFESPVDVIEQQPLSDVPSSGSAQLCAKELALAFLEYCCAALKHGASFALPTSYWFMSDGLDEVAKLVKEVWLHSEACAQLQQQQFVVSLGYEFLRLLLRVADLFPHSALEILAVVNRILSESPVPEHCLTLLVTEFSLLSLSDMSGTSRREVLRLYSDHLVKPVANMLSADLTDVRHKKDLPSAERLSSACSCVGKAIEWGSPTVVSDLLSVGIWRDVCCLASMSNHEWSLSPRYLILSGCCRHKKLFDYSFRVPSLVSILPRQAPDSSIVVEDFLWALLLSASDVTPTSQASSYRTMLGALISDSVVQLKPSDDAFPTWCIVSQLLEALATVRASIRGFLKPSLEVLKSAVRPHLTSGLLTSDAALQPAGDGGEEADDSARRTRQPKWRQSLKSINISLKKLLDGAEKHD